MKIREKEKELLAYLEEIDMYTYASNIMQYDAHTIIPKKGYEDFTKVSTFFSTKIFKMYKSPDFIKLIGELHTKLPKLNRHLQALVKHLQEEIDNIQAIPDDEMEAFQRLTSESYEVWQKARNTNDFGLWAPYLKEIVATTRKFINYRKQKFSTPYNALLNDFERGMDEDKLDLFFGGLKENIVPLLKQIIEKNKKMPLESLSFKAPILKQKEFNLYLLNTLSFDMDCGYIAQSAHPFTMSITRNDVRLTTRYLENNFTYNMYSTIHEAGHGIYDQNEPEKIYKYHLNTTSYGVHEMHSRFYENHIGKSKEFIDLVAPKMKRLFKGPFKKVSQDDLYLAINNIAPSLIRTEADELTYSLHILIRYEIEKDLINGKVEVEDLPKLWNEKYAEYLGVEVPSDEFGILQDVHWSDGSFGYFPSYALGNAYAAQIWHKMRTELDFKGLIEKNKLKEIKKWLIKHTFPYGKTITPNEWILKVTGEPLNYKYYVEYLTAKFKEIYDL